MERSALPRKRIAKLLCSIAFMQWLLFELIRIPYRPPEDMLTLLGTEKYGLIGLMVCLAAVGFLLILFWSVQSIWTKRDVVFVSTLVLILLGSGLIIVLYPAWPVTPFNWILR
ncbi:hypothetical protein SAMN05421753_112188 [Planctomicrobium piriforme]|uniref:Uncharacterized protein n=1 Tax=Planctomicrobium piriforme TaxID=1576369 RepID=A0A1I3LAI7_9PLAN|nr:hypothetical protein SAMN05421753_112188 [Planctomicrobium piriforme]